jgi:hypothetical protein
MSWLSKLLRSPESPPPATADKTAALDGLAAQFDAMKDEYLKVLVGGLSDPDQNERRSTVYFIFQNVLPALEDDKNAESQQQSLRTILALGKELRAPATQDELNDLANAVFFFAMRRLRAASEA